MEVYAPFRCPGCGRATAGKVHGYCTWTCYDEHDWQADRKKDRERR